MHQHHPRFAVAPCWRALFLSIVLFVASACSTAPAAQPTVAVPPTSVKVQLGWVHEYSSAGFYAAEKQGYFAEQNLQVELIAGGFGEQGYIDPVAQVLNGTADFGIASAASLLQARAAGQPVTALASIFQRSPAAIISLESSNITRPADLVGRTVAVADSAMGSYTLLLKTQNIDPASINTVPRTNYGIEPLLNGEVDAIYAWVINEGVLLREAGQTPSILLLSDYGIETYDLVLFTSEKMITEKPDTITRFLQASLQGWQQVIDDPKQAAQLTMSYNPELDLAGQQQRIEAALPLLKPAGGQLGAMDVASWQSTQQVLLEQQLLTKPLDLQSVYQDSFYRTLTPQETK